MQKFMNISEYCRESGFPVKAMRQLTKCYLADQFCFRRSGAVNATIIINVPVFEKMLERGDFKEVLEG